MTNTSATGGPLAPTLPPPAPLEGVALVSFLQGIVAGITGLPGDMIRQRWQAEPPNLPDMGTDWAAVGIHMRPADTFAAVVHHGDGDGFDELQRHEVLHMLCSFYGPNADAFAALLRDGLQVAQNREPLLLAGMGLVGCGDAIAVPQLVKQVWLYRTDLEVQIRRVIVRVYPVLNLESAVGTISSEAASVPIDVHQ